MKEINETLDELLKQEIPSSQLLQHLGPWVGYLPMVKDNLVVYVRDNRQLTKLVPIINQLNRPVLLLCEPCVDEEVEVNDNVNAFNIPVLGEELPELQRYGASFYALLEALQPEGVLTVEECHWKEQVLIAVAQKRSIPCISIRQTMDAAEGNVALLLDIIHRTAPCRYTATTGCAKLHLGCGPFVMEGWLNVDIRCEEPGIRYLDAGKPYPFPDHSFDYIYSEHLFEHLPVDAQSMMLQECCRILKPGGRIRLAMPNLHFLMDLYQSPEKECNRRYLAWSYELFGTKEGLPEVTEKDYPIHVINNFFHLWGHQFIHTPESLEHLAEGIGFQNIQRCEIGHSDIPALQGLEKHGEFIPAWANELETFVVEMEKRQTNH